MSNLKFFYRACLIIFILLTFIFAPLIYFQNKSMSEHLHFTKGEVISSEIYYFRAKTNRTVGHVTVSFFNDVQGQEMQRIGVIEEDEIPNYQSGMIIEIAYTEGHEFLSENDDQIIIEPSKRMASKQAMIAVILTGLGFLILGFCLRLIYFKKLKVQN